MNAQLQVSLMELSSSRETQMWTAPRSSDTNWRKIRVNIGRVDSPFSILFNGRRSFGTQSGNLAIDDVQTMNCNFPATKPNCKPEEFRCGTRGCVALDRVCNFTDGCGDFSDEKVCQAYPAWCSFERDLCSWGQNETENFDWRRQSDRTSSTGSGTTHDHARGINPSYYLYIETSSPRRPGDKLRLVSATLAATGAPSQCVFGFYYHMLGFDIGDLTVYTRTAQGGALKQVWKKSGQIGDLYERGDIALREAQPFQVVLEGVVGKGYRGDMAIDDVCFSSGCVVANAVFPAATAPIPTKSPCGADFQCGDGTYIPTAEACDFTPQCADKSDEASCGQCDF